MLLSLADVSIDGGLDSPSESAVVELFTLLLFSLSISSSSSIVHWRAKLVSNAQKWGKKTCKTVKSTEMNVKINLLWLLERRDYSCNNRYTEPALLVYQLLYLLGHMFLFFSAKNFASCLEKTLYLLLLHFEQTSKMSLSNKESSMF